MQENQSEVWRVVKNILLFSAWVLLSQIPLSIVMMPFIIEETMKQMSPGVDISSMMGTVNLLFSIVGIILGVVVIVIFWRYYNKQRATNPIEYQPLTKWKSGSINYLSAGLAGVIVIILFQMFVFPTTDTSENQAVLDAMLNYNPWPIMAMSVIFAPISEELLYRGIFYHYFFRVDSSVGVFTGILVNGILFACMHDTSFTIVMVPYLLLGCLFAWSYRKSGDLKVSMILHFANNLLAVVLPLFVR